MSEAPARPNVIEYSVSEISAALKRTVEDSFGFVRVRGEVSNLKVHSSGHIYFDLKDENACLNAVIWRMTARRLKIKPEKGIEVICIGRITTYGAASRYQMVVDVVELAGLGALMAMLEARKAKLASEGLFDAARKKKLPFLPGVIGVVTSPTGAVLRDIMHRINARFPRRVLLWPAMVQGEQAAASLVAAIRGFNSLGPTSRLPRPDVLIVARGGGSLEDLMPFNEEAVVRAVAESAIPVIAGVGHETDTTLVDFAADLRAPTPSAAAELAVPLRTELLARSLNLDERIRRAHASAARGRRQTLNQLLRLLPRESELFAVPRQRLDQAGDKLGSALGQNLQRHRRAFLELASHVAPKSLAQHIVLCRERLGNVTARLVQSGTSRLGESWRALETLDRVLDSVSYRAVLERGFVLVRGADGRVHRRAQGVSSGERLKLTFADGEADAIAHSPTVIPRPRRIKARVSPDQGKLF